jgi:glycosyltransferase involved in cell wall biosynthesis
MKKTAILFMIPLIRGYGGTEKHILSILGNIDRDFFIPYLCYFQGDRKNSLLKNFEEQNIQTIKFPMQTIYKIDALKNAWRIKNFVRKKDIKILQTFHPNADLFGPPVGRISGIPILISSRRDLGLNRTKTALQKKINRLVNKIIVPSEAVKKATMEQEKIDDSKIKVIYNGVDIEYFRPEGKKEIIRRKLGYEKTDFVITIISNLKKIKGIDCFIKAAFLINEKIPSAKFIIIGGGEEKDYFTNLSTDLGLTNKIVFTGNISNVKDYLAISDIYISSSLTEGFSNSILEAMAMGLPIIATDVGGNREAVVDHECGFLVSVQDYHAIAFYAKKLYRNNNLRSKMGEKSRKIVTNIFALKKMVKEHEKFYSTLLQQQS